MKVLVACEFTGVVRDAFRKAGHQAFSCDLDDVEPEGRYPEHHLFGDCRQYLDDGWDLLIAHPPCDYLAQSGARWLYGGKGRVRDEERWRKMVDAATFFRALLHAPVPMIAVENPIMSLHAVRIIGRGHTQLIQPWQFGHGETKATCLWLKNLPGLKHTKIMMERKARVYQTGESSSRKAERSITYPGIAAAMAEQWGAWAERRRTGSMWD